jgi:hypothetical protein
MRAVFRVELLLAALALAVSGCTGGNARPDSGVAGVDAAMDAGAPCSDAGYYPQHDRQCASNAGCTGVATQGCGCQCARCSDTKCVLEVCPECPGDAGLDAGDARDGGPADQGHADTGCLDPLDLDGSYLDANWDAVKVFVATVAEDDLGEQYFAWTVPTPEGLTSRVDYLVLDTKTVHKVPNCSRIDLVRTVAVCGDWSYWINYVTYNGTGPMEVFGFLMKPPYVLTKQLTELENTAGLFCNSGTDVLVRYLDQDYHARFNLYPRGDFSAPRNISLYNADKAGYIRLTDKAVVFVVPNPRDEILDTCMRSHDLATDKETQILCGAGTYILDSHGNRVVYQDWKNYADFGHGQSDVFVYDLDTGKETEVTHDEYGQWCPVIHGDIVAYQDLTEFQGHEGGLGYLWVYDLSTGIRRKVPIDSMEGCPTGMNAKYIAFREGFSPIQNKMFLIDMEKAGVVKDGHVVPEAGDGGGGQ